MIVQVLKLLMREDQLAISPSSICGEQYFASTVSFPQWHCFSSHTHGSFSRKQVTTAPVFALPLKRLNPTRIPRQSAIRSIDAFMRSPKRGAFLLFAHRTPLCRSQDMMALQRLGVALRIACRSRRRILRARMNRRVLSRVSR